MNKLIKQFDNQETLGVISLYPKKGELYSTGISGIASFAKNTVTHLPRKVIILCQRDTSYQTIYKEKNALIMRSFKNGKLSMWIRLIFALKRFKLIKKLLIHFDFALYGSMINSTLFLPFLFVLRILGYQTSVVLHSVVTDIQELSGHLGLKQTVKDNLKAFIMNKIFHIFYFLVGKVTHSAIVTDEGLKQKLSHYIPESKIVNITHGVDEKLHPLSKETARKKLKIAKNKEVVLFFGFVNWFKGADFYVDTFLKTKKLLGKNVQIIIAGGKSPTLKDKTYYQKYFEEVKRKINDSSRMTITGFIPQNKLGLYFSAADLIVFPYRAFFCASGVLSLVFSYQRPFIVSEALSPMLEVSDIKQLMKEVNLDGSHITFPLEKKAFIRLTAKVLKNGLKRKIIKLAKLIREERSWKRSAILYDQTLFAKNMGYVKEFKLMYAKTVLRNLLMYMISYFAKGVPNTIKILK